MSARAGLISALAVAVVVTTSAAARAQDPPAQDPLDRLLGQTISAVELQVEGRPDTSAPLLALVDIKPGEPFAIETYRRVADRFNQVPRFQSVRVLAAERPTGLVLIFDLEPRHPVDRLEFPGEETGLPESDLQRLVRDRFSGLPAFTRLGEVEDVVRLILEEEGFRSASVTADLVRFHDPDRSTLNIQIRAGQRTMIRSIKVNGQSPFSTEEILKKLGIAVGQPYRERELLADLAKLRDDLRGKGYYTANPDYEATTDGAAVDLVLTTDSGPLVTLIVKGDGLPGSKDDFIPIKRQGSVDQDLLFDSRLATERELRRQGYWHATVTYESQETPQGRIITFTITRGKRYRIDHVLLPAGLHIGQADVAGIKQLKAGEWFSEEAVIKALLALAAIYQQDGYYQVKLDPKYDEVAGPSESEGAVVIVPNIVEGPRAVITGITFDLGPDATIRESDLRGIMKSKQLTPPAPYVPAHLFYDRQALPSYYESQGFLDHKLQIVPEFNAAGTEAILHVKAVEGPRVVVGEITVVGNDRVSRESILHELTLQVGQPYSDAARIESQRRLYNMGFRSVLVTAQPRLPGEADTRIVVSVVETGSITFGFGGGIEGGTTPRNVPGGGVEDRLEFSPRGSIDVGRRNLGGHNRSVNFFARVSLKPRNSDDPELDGKGFGFTEYRVSGTFQERYAFRSNSDVLLGVSSEQAVRSTFSYLRRGVTADFVRPLPHAMSLSTRYSFEITRVFDARVSDEEQSLIDRLFPQVRLSILSGTLFRDRRDNQAAPSKGSLITAGHGLRSPRARIRSGLRQEHDAGLLL
jgi:outer membrane protein assembly factor BamA